MTRRPGAGSGAALSALFGAWAALSAPAVAGAQGDVGELEACVAEEADARDCVGLISAPCMAVPGGETTEGMMSCAARETAAWDVLLERDFRTLSARSDEIARTKLREAQRAWVAWRDADCDYAADQYRGGSLGRVTAAICMMERTAGRSLHLNAYLNSGS